MLILGRLFASYQLQ